MAAYILSEAAAEAEIRKLLERFLQVGRLACGVGGVVRVRSPRCDGEDAYSFRVDLQTRCVVSYRGPAGSWFDGAHLPLEELRQVLAERGRREQDREQARQERRVAHERRMREEQAAARGRVAAALGPTWPVLPDGYYNQAGDPVPVPWRRRPIHDEARIRFVGRLGHVVFHSDALNSPFLREVPVERRCEVLRRVVDVLLRASSKGRVVIGSDAVTVAGKGVTLTLTPDCAVVRTLTPEPGKIKNLPRYRIKDWVKPHERAGEAALLGVELGDARLVARGAADAGAVAGPARPGADV